MANGNDAALAAEIALAAALNYNSVPSQEYLLLGSVLDDHVETLLELLRGLCDNFEENFSDRETRYDSHINDVKGRPLQLRVRRSLMHADAPCALRYLGKTEQGNPTQPTSVRTSLHIGVSDQIDEFLLHSGFEKGFEYLASGHVFKKGRMKITVSKIMGALMDKTVPSYELVSKSFLVEMSVVERTNSSTAAPIEMRRLADCLKPVVDMIKPED